MSFTRRELCQLWINNERTVHLLVAPKLTAERKQEAIRLICSNNERIQQHLGQIDVWGALQEIEKAPATTSRKRSSTSS